MNLCELSDEKLYHLFEYLGISEIYNKSEEKTLLVSGKVAERRWEWYDKIIVTPTEIKYSKDPYPTHTIFTEDVYNSMKNLIEIMDR